MGARRHATPTECAVAYHKTRALVEEFGKKKVADEAGVSESLLGEILRRDGKHAIARTTIRHIERAEQALKKPISVSQAMGIRTKVVEPQQLGLDRGLLQNLRLPPASPAQEEKPVIPLHPPTQPEPAPAPETPKPAAALDPIALLRKARQNAIAAVDLLGLEVELLGQLALPALIAGPVKATADKLMAAVTSCEEALKDIEI